MEVISEKTYSVMEGEPHLGKQTETIVRVDREEYLEALMKAFSDGANETSDGFTMQGLYEQEYTLGDDLNQTDVDFIVATLDMTLLDDEYGTEKEYGLIYGLLDEAIPQDWEDTFEVVEMKGY